MTGTARDHLPQMKAPKEKRLSHPIKENEHRKKRLPNQAVSGDVFAGHSVLRLISLQKLPAACILLHDVLRDFAHVSFGGPANRAPATALLVAAPISGLGDAHAQFIYGLFAAGLFAAVNLVQDWASHRGLATGFLDSPLLPSRTLLVLLGACELAICIGPYSYHLHSVIINYATSKFPYIHIAEFQPLLFRTYTDFVQLFFMLSVSLARLPL
ncbi:MAG TPA: hypothetical protein VMU26_03370 [Candidatus Polarisedimenticolia bacterium]|nr:hypothetical protein [Candidatus Polarisedimenticolia bacterium]